MGDEPFVLCAEVHNDGTLGPFGVVFPDDQTPSTWVSKEGERLRPRGVT